MYRILMCSAIVALLFAPAMAQAAPPGKTTIAHIGDVAVTAETPIVEDGVEIGTAYTVTSKQPDGTGMTMIILEET